MQTFYLVFDGNHIRFITDYDHEKYKKEKMVKANGCSDNIGFLLSTIKGEINIFCK